MVVYMYICGVHVGAFSASFIREFNPPPPLPFGLPDFPFSEGGGYLFIIIPPLHMRNLCGTHEP